jgi:hypothetical protein
LPNYLSFIKDNISANRNNFIFYQAILDLISVDLELLKTQFLLDLHKF